MSVDRRGRLVQLPARPSRRIPPGRGIFGLAVVALLLLAGLCTRILCSRLQAAQPENPLRPERLLPKLKGETGEAVEVPELPGPLPPLEPEPPAPPVARPRVPAPVETMTPARREEAPSNVPILPAAPRSDEPPLALPSAAVEVCPDPLVYTHPRAPQPLESPMLRNWKTVALYTLLAAAPVAAPSPAQAQGFAGKDLDKINQRLEQLEQKDVSRVELLDRMQKDLRRLEQIDAMKKDLVALADRVQIAEDRKATATNPGGDDARADVRKLESMLSQVLELQKTMQADLDSFRKDVGGLKKDVATLQSDRVENKSRLDNLELQLKLLQDDVKGLQKRLDGGTTVGSSPVGSAPVAGITPALDDIRSKLASIEQSLRGLSTSSVRFSNAPPVGGGLSVPGATGHVTLENLYPEDMLFIVNGKETRLLPNGMLTLDGIPAGSLRYEVVSPTWGLRAQKTTSLGPNETLRITAR